VPEAVATGNQPSAPPLCQCHAHHFVARHSAPSRRCRRAILAPFLCSMVSKRASMIPYVTCISQTLNVPSMNLSPVLEGVSCITARDLRRIVGASPPVYGGAVYKCTELSGI
jgi:hypothetical protein